jgi:ComF family protein
MIKKNLLLIKNLILDILFPKFCVNCDREGTYLCEDCLAVIDVSEYQYCAFCYPAKIVLNGKTCNSCKKRKKLDELFCATSYDEKIVKKMLRLFKYEPYAKELSKPLSDLIITHFQVLGKIPEIDLIIPVPLHKNKLKNRGFNQSEKIALFIARFLKKPLLAQGLVKIKKTDDQMSLDKGQRQKNLKNAFFCPKPEIVKGKKILLIDDILTTGATIEECAQTLKRAGAREVCATVVARSE